MTLKKLRAKRRKLSRRIKRRQSWAAKLRAFAKWARRKKLAGVAKKATEVEKRLRAKARELGERLREVEKEIELHTAAGEKDRASFVRWVRSKLGVDENDDEANQWVRSVMGYGSASSIPWCAIFVTVGLKRLGFTPPPSPAYSGSWLTWSQGTRVSWSQAKPGDLLIFDWGDGGMTDHIAVYVGDGLCIGGNQRDTDSGGAVTQVPVTASSLVGVVRPKWND